MLGRLSDCFFEFSVNDAIACINGLRVHEVEGVMYTSDNTPFTGRVLDFYEREFFEKKSIINYDEGLMHGDAW